MLSSYIPKRITLADIASIYNDDLAHLRPLGEVTLSTDWISDELKITTCRGTQYEQGFLKDDVWPPTQDAFLERLDNYLANKKWYLARVYSLGQSGPFWLEQHIEGYLYQSQDEKPTQNTD